MSWNVYPSFLSNSIIKHLKTNQKRVEINNEEDMEKSSS